MKEKYECVKLEIIRFETKDVIITSPAELYGYEDPDEDYMLPVRR